MKTKILKLQSLRERSREQPLITFMEALIKFSQNFGSK